MKALGRSPQWVSETATTAASRMEGWVASCDSRATEEMFSPPVGRGAGVSGGMILNRGEWGKKGVGTAYDYVFCSVEDLGGTVGMPDCEVACVKGAAYE